jgi:hypothetical protein
MKGPINLFNLFKKKSKIETPAESKSKPEKPIKSAKDIATEAGEPYVEILGMQVDADNLHQGSFELDWNSIFVTRLVKAGYMMKETDTDTDIVDRWFQNVCRHVVMETWEQEEAMNPQARFIRSRDLGDGRREHS